ncbi:hypothetical protein ACJMK2_033491 [Sinanodonta woodiana]|uniref:DNA damage-inducible transcript 4-like protein n=1 Tax=Sinanodonta woodiana TaxID=1069815 RepID=A0ABD3WPW5_SINWO
MEFSEAGETIQSNTDLKKLMHKMKFALHRMFRKEQKNCDPACIIETDHDRREDLDVFDYPETLSYGTFDEPGAVNLSRTKEIASLIERDLRAARDKHLHCEILIPCGLISKIARDILIMADNEPCGIRGCCLHISLQERNVCQKLVQVAFDPLTVSTFEVHLTLHEDTRSWCSVKKLFISITGCLKDSKWTQSPKLLCQGYKLEKKKLYRTDS